MLMLWRVNVLDVLKDGDGLGPNNRLSPEASGRRDLVFSWCHVGFRSCSSDDTMV